MVELKHLDVIHGWTVYVGPYLLAVNRHNGINGTVSLRIYMGIIGTTTLVFSFESRPEDSEFAKVVEALIHPPFMPLEIAFDRLTDLFPTHTILAVARELLNGE